MMFALCVLAQTQVGYVKTPGRINGKNRVPGKGLTDALVRTQDRSIVVKNSNGSFSFPVPSRHYVIKAVEKKGYQLVDADVAPKSYDYSSAPIYLIMETPDQMAANKLKTERTLRSKLNKRLQQKEAEIDALKEQNRITQEQYLKVLQQLYDQQESDEHLIGEMAAYYSRIDYDLLDDFNTQVSEFILDGELARADSLLRSKGDIDERIRQLNRHHDANVQMREQLKKSENVERVDREDLARDCFSFFWRFALDNQSDSAMKYIESRASLDATNCQWQADAGSYLMQQGFAAKAGEYFDRALLTARQLAQEAPEQYEPLLARTLNNIGLLYSDADDLATAEPLFAESQELFYRLAQDDPDTYLPQVASSKNNMAVLYSGSAARADKVERLLLEALEIYQTLSASGSDYYSSLAAKIMNNLGLLYEQRNNGAGSEQMYLQALNLYRQLDDTSNDYSADYAATLTNLSALYFNNGTNGNEVLRYLNESIDVYRRLAVDDPRQFAPMLAVALNDISVCDFSMNRQQEGEQALTEALDIYRGLVDKSPDRYLPMLAKGLYEQGVRSFRYKNLEKSESLFSESLQDYKELSIRDEAKYLPQVAKLLRNLASVCDMRQRWAEAEQFYQEELVINRKLADKMPSEYKSHLARNLGNLSNHAILVKDFAQAVEYARAGLAIDDSRLFIQANLAAALLFKGEQEPAMAIYRKYKKELRDTFLDDFRQFEALGIIPQEAQQAVKTIKQFINQ